jgi:O-antigen/teichoic acid export membrane protein
VILFAAADGELQLGYYSLAILVTGQIAGIASMFSLVLAPRYGQLLGATNDPRAVARLAAGMTEAKAALMACVVLLTAYATRPVFGILLPAYTPGIEPLLIRLPGALAVALAMPASQYLVTVDRQRSALACLVLPLLFSCLAGWLAMKQGHGIIGLSWAMTLGDIAYWVSTSCVAFRRELGSKRWTSHLSILAIYALPPLGFCIFASRESETATAFIASFLVVLTAVYLTWRGGLQFDVGWGKTQCAAGR